MKPLAFECPALIDCAVDRSDAPRNVVLAWMPGSGGTLVHLWLRCLGFSPRTTHGDVGQADEYRIAIHRDPRDAVCSLAQRKFAKKYRVDAEAGLLHACKDFWHNRWVRCATENAGAARLSIRFEDYFYGHEVELLRALMSALRVQASGAYQDYLLWEFSLERNRARASLRHDFGDYDPVTRIHGKHITSGRVGVWREMMTPRVLEWVERHWGNELDALGYERVKDG